MSRMVPQIQKSTTKAAMAKISSQIDSLKVERQTLYRQLDKIEERLSVLRAEYGSIFNASSPLLNLPAEITCLIFDYVATPPPGYGYDRLFPLRADDDELPFQRRTEVDISHVCKRWRDISLNYPRLWSRYFYWEVHDLLCDDTLQRLATYLNRSSTQSLELYLCFREDPITPRSKHAVEPDYRAKMLDMILANIERWKIVTIRAELDQRAAHWLRRLGHASAPKLEYFSFCPEDPPFRTGQASTAIEEEDGFDSSESAGLQCTTFKGGAPKLSYIHLGGSSTILPPLSNVTTLRIELEFCEDSILSWPAMLQVFQIPTLVNLSIVGNVFHPPLLFEGLPLITMNNLKHLRYDNDHMTLLLPYLRMPLLESLSLRNIWMPEEFGTTVSTPNPDAGYFFPSLKSLTLIDSTASTIMAAGYFMSLTKNASMILLSVEEPDENILNTLPPYTLGGCWPNLSKLILHLSADDEIELVIGLVANDTSRRNQSVQVWLCGDLEKIWRESEPGQFMRLQSECGVDTVKHTPEQEMFNVEVLRMVSPVWPPVVGEFYPDYSNNEDPFEILVLE